MAVCWRIRPCSEEIQKECKHAVTDFDMCPSRCNFSFCQLETHEITGDPDLVFNPDIDRSQALKQNCLYCVFFLENGPRKKTAAEEGIE